MVQTHKSEADTPLIQHPHLEPRTLAAVDSASGDYRPVGRSVRSRAGLSWARPHPQIRPRVKSRPSPQVQRRQPLMVNGRIRLRPFFWWSTSATVLHESSQFWGVLPFRVRCGTRVGSPKYHAFVFSLGRLLVDLLIRVFEDKGSQTCTCGAVWGHFVRVPAAQSAEGSTSMGETSAGFGELGSKFITIERTGPTLAWPPCACTQSRSWRATFLQPRPKLT